MMRHCDAWQPHMGKAAQAWDGEPHPAAAILADDNLGLLRYCAVLKKRCQILVPVLPGDSLDNHLHKVTGR